MADEEVSVLQSIFFDDLDVTFDNDNHPVSIRLTIHSNGDENDVDNEKRLLCVTVTFSLPSGYPIESPTVTLSKPRGLTDQQIDKLYEIINNCLKMNENNCVIYECIELIRGHLCQFDMPSEGCSICLSPMHDRKQIIRTQCYHYYHMSCLASYVTYKKLELEKEYNEAKRNGFYIKKGFLNDVDCPVCRQLLSNDILTKVQTLTNESHKKKIEDDIENVMTKTISPKVRLWQQQMEILYQQQKEKGGIIDLERNDLVFS